MPRCRRDDVAFYCGFIENVRLAACTAPVRTRSRRGRGHAATTGGATSGTMATMARSAFMRVR